jgi:hypothetical protein
LRLARVLSLLVTLTVLWGDLPQPAWAAAPRRAVRPAPLLQGPGGRRQVFRTDFNVAGNFEGWNIMRQPANTSVLVTNGYLQLSTLADTNEYPVVERAGIPWPAGDMEIEWRFSSPDAAGRAGFGVNTWVTNGFTKIGSYGIYGSPAGYLWSEYDSAGVIPQGLDADWHTALIIRHGGVYDFYLDGAYRASWAYGAAPTWTAIGDPTTQTWAGLWLTMRLDYYAVFDYPPTPTPTATATATTTKTNTPTATPTATATRPPTSTPSATPAPTATPTRTATATATRTATPATPTATPTATVRPVILTLQATYRYLQWYGPVTQVLTGRYSGPAPVGGRTIAITCETPEGDLQVTTVRTAWDGSFTLLAGPWDPYFGTTVLSTWRAQARDVSSGVYSNPVIWDVIDAPINTATPTPTATLTTTPSATVTPSRTPTVTPIATATASATATPTPSPRATATATPTWTPTHTLTPSATATASPTRTPTPTLTPSCTPTATTTATPTRTPTPTPPPTATATRTPTVTATASPTRTATPIPVTLELRTGYRYLLWYGPVTQVLTGRYAGPAPLGGRIVLVTYRTPGGGVGGASLTTAADGRFSLAAAPGNPDFGTTEIGTWRAQARDVARGVLSNEVVWDVKWFRIHLRQ